MRPNALSELAQSAAFIESVNNRAGAWARLIGRWDGAVPSPEQFIFSSPWPMSERGFFEENRIKFTRTRPAPSTLRYVLSADSLRKKIIREITVQELPAGACTVRIVADEKFDALAFLHTGFSLPSPREWVRIRAQAHLSNKS